MVLGVGGSSPLSHPMKRYFALVILLLLVLTACGRVESRLLTVAHKSYIPAHGVLRDTTDQFGTYTYTQWYDECWRVYFEEGIHTCLGFTLWRSLQIGDIREWRVEVSNDGLLIGLAFWCYERAELYSSCRST